MRGGIRLGRLLGISIEIDWSWIFIFLLVTWNLAAGVFPQIHPDWGAALNWGVAVAAALLFFSSVLLHELAHSLVARAMGIPVRRITLFLFGGVSNIEREPPSPAAEFLMAVVGPVTSVLLGLIFWFLGGVVAGPVGDMTDDPVRVFARVGPAATLLLWLGPVNVLVGLFNCIPGFPLDGGRMLRSAFWALTGNLRKATRWASAVGQLVAWLFIVAGFAMVFGVRVPLLGTGLIGGLWLAFIGWFLNSAAQASYQQVVIHDLLEDIPVSRLMRRDAHAVPPGTSVDALVDDWVMKTDEHSFPVAAGDRLAGVVTLEDVRKVARARWGETPVEEIMTPADRLVIVSPRDEVKDALVKLSGLDVRQAPVVEDGRLLGVLLRRDILRWLQVQSDFGAGRGLAAPEDRISR